MGAVIRELSPHSASVLQQLYVLTYPAVELFPFKIINSAGLGSLSSGNYWVCQKIGFAFLSRPFHHLLESFELRFLKNLQNSSPEAPVLFVVC